LESRQFGGALRDIREKEKDINLEETDDRNELDEEL